MAFHRGSSSIGTVIAVLVAATAIAGNMFLDWTWSNPEGKLLPLVIGVVAAVVGGLVMFHRMKS